MVHITQKTAPEQETIDAFTTGDAKLPSSNGKNGAEIENVVVSYRGSIIESQHQIYAAIVSSSRKLLHSSEPWHIAHISAVLTDTGKKESVLAYGGHPAQNASVNRAWIKSDFTSTPLGNNCYREHAGIVAGVLSLGAVAHDSYLPDRPMQKAVYRAVENVSRLKEEEVGWTVDGFNLPTPTMPLCSLGIMFAKLTDAADQVDDSGESSFGEQTRHLSHIYKAMSVDPGLVPGE